MVAVVRDDGNLDGCAALTDRPLRRWEKTPDRLVDRIVLTGTKRRYSRPVGYLRDRRDWKRLGQLTEEERLVLSAHQGRLADWLRYWLNPIGVQIAEVSGWQTRGNTFPVGKPTDSIAHHTAGGASGETPSFNICVNGRSDLPGPLCNTYVNRSASVVYVVAAGKANHAGSGGWAGETSNYGAFGTEMENPGTAYYPWSAHHHEVTARIHAAHLSTANEANGQHNTGASCCDHWEWTVRKIDRHSTGGRSGPAPQGHTTDWMRARVDQLLAAGPAPGLPPPPPALEEADMSHVQHSGWTGTPHSPNARFVIVGVGADNGTLYAKWFHPTRGWLGWQDLGARIVGEFTLSFAEGRADVTAAAEDTREELHWWFDPAADTWYGPERLGGVLGDARDPFEIDLVAMIQALHDKIVTPDVDEETLASALGPLIQPGITQAEAVEAVKIAFRQGIGGTQGGN